MREIKFRAWDTIEKQMADVDLINFPVEDGLEIRKGYETYWRSEKEAILMQYTNEKDDEGNEIFEDDILEYDCSDCGEKHRTHARWDDGAFIIDVCGDEFDTYTISYINYNLEGVKVIGNIHENPELIKE